MKGDNKIGRPDFSTWLQFAEEDFLSAKTLLESGIYNQVCFHSQQAVEKMLKAFLKSRGIVPPKIHSLLELLEMCKEEGARFDSFQEGCEYLSRFYVPTRYPDALPGSLPEGLPNLEDARKALDFAEEIMEFVGKVLES